MALVNKYYLNLFSPGTWLSCNKNIEKINQNLINFYYVIQKRRLKMKKFFIFIFLLYITNSISAEYSFEFEGSWLEAEPNVTKNLATGKVLADFHDVHVV